MGSTLGSCFLYHYHQRVVEGTAGPNPTRNASFSEDGRVGINVESRGSYLVAKEQIREVEHGFDSSGRATRCGGSLSRAGRKKKDFGSETKHNSV